MKKALRHLALGTLAFALFAGCGGSGHDYIHGPGGQANYSTVVTNRQEFGMLYLTRFPGITTVDVLPVGSKIPLFSLTTNEAGAFDIPAGTLLPPEFILSAEAPEGVTVERYVEAGEKPHLFINGISTIMSRYKQRHPEMSLSEIEGRVRTTLGIGDREGLYGVSDSAYSPFSHQLFLQRAREAGGVRPFVESLLERIERDETLSFRNGKILSQKLKEMGAPVIVLAEEGDDGGIVGFLGEEVASLVIGEVAADITGKVNTAIGLNLGTEGEFQEVDAQLEHLNALISNAFNAAKTTWVQNAAWDLQEEIGKGIDNLDDVREGLQSGIDDYRSYLQATGQTENVDHGPAPLQGSVARNASNFNVVVTNSVVDTFTRCFTAGVGNIHPPSENLFKAVSDNTSVQELAGPYKGTDYWNGLPLRRDDLLPSIISNYEYYYGYLTLLADTLSELATTQAYLPTDLNPSTYNPPAPILNKALAQINILYGEVAMTGVRWVPEPVGCDFVLTDVPNQKQWYFPTGLGTYDAAQNNLINLEINNWRRAPGVPTPPHLGSDVKDDLANFSRPADMAGWRLPELYELQQMRSHLLAINPNISEDEKVYKSAMAKLGFILQSNQNDHSNFKKMWYNGSVTQAGKNAHVDFHYFDMMSGEIHETTTVGQPFEDSKFSWLYVRTLNYFADADFSDNGRQDFMGYGAAANPMTLHYDEPLKSGSVVPCYAVGSRYGVNHPVDFTDYAVWSVAGDNPDIAFLTYGLNENKEYRVFVNFREAGTATLRLTFTNNSGDPYYVETTVTGSAPYLESIAVTSKNVLFGSVPQASDFYRFYCTGFLSSGEAVDLTQNVEWSTDTAIPAGTDQARFATSGGDGGNFEFGDPTALPTRVTVRATYNPGDFPTGNRTWLDNPQGSLTDTSTFGYSQ